MRKLRALGLIGCCSAALTGYSTTAFAQESPGADIVVTALKRSERLQDVPVSMVAVSGDALAEQRITNVIDLTSVVPNLGAARGTSPSFPLFALRGVSFSIQPPVHSGPVATYYDEAYIGIPPLMPVGMFDLERVEVLRGPQGTLYGKNTTGGAINFISKKPGYKTEGFVTAGFGNYNRLELTAAVQTGLSDKIAIRLAGTAVRADGYQRNLLPGYSDLNSTREYGVRAQILFEPSSDLRFILKLSRSERHPVNFTVDQQLDASGGVIGIGGGFFVPPYFPTGLKHWEVETDYTPKLHQQVNSVALTGNLDLSDDMTLTSITSYDDGKLLAPQELDGSPTHTFDTLFDTKANAFSQDLRLTTSFAGPFNVTVGGYYSRENVNHLLNLYYFSDAGGTTCNLAFFGNCTATTSFKQRKRTAAIYADATYDLTSSLTARLGLRYTHDTGRVFDYLGGFFNPGPRHPYIKTGDGAPVFIGINNARASYALNDLSGRIGLDYKITPDVMIYGSYSRGFRGPGFGDTGTISVDEITPSKDKETLDSFEVGLKSQWLDRTLTLNGAVFHYIFRNQQIFNPLPDGRIVLAAIPKSRIIGAELELTYLPVRSLEIKLGAALASSRILEGFAVGQNLVGNQLPNAGKWTGNASINWTFLSNEQIKATAGLDGNYSSRIYYGLFNLKRVSQSAYALLNGHLTFSSADDKYSVTLWGRNLTNKAYLINDGDGAFLGGSFSNLGTPRTYGASVTAKF